MLSIEIFYIETYSEVYKNKNECMRRLGCLAIINIAAYAKRREPLMLSHTQMQCYCLIESVLCYRCEFHPTKRWKHYTAFIYGGVTFMVETRETKNVN